MVVNASARNYRIWVSRPDEDGSEVSWLEVTDYCQDEGFLSITDHPIDTLSGLQKTTGTLSLSVPPYDDRFDPWRNPARWAVGNAVRVRVADESGTLRRHPRSRLRILSVPEPPYPGNWKLEVEIGDRLTLNSQVMPVGIADDEPGTRISRTNAVIHLLDMIGLTFDGELPGEDLINWRPEPDRPIVEQAGELAIGGYSVLYQKSDGVIACTRINLRPETRLFKHVVGTDDAADYQPHVAPARPPSTVEVVSDESAVADRSLEQEEEDTAELSSGGRSYVEYLPRNAIDETDSSSDPVISLQYIENWSWSGATYTRQIQEIKPRGLVISEDMYKTLEASRGGAIARPGMFSLITASLTTETQTYEPNGEGRLLQKQVTTIAPKGAVLSEWYKKNLQATDPLPGFTDNITVEQTATTYTYTRDDDAEPESGDTQGQVRSILTVKNALKGNVAASANDWTDTTVSDRNPEKLITVQYQEQSWRRRNFAEWEQTDRLFEAGRVRSGKISGFTRLIPVRNEVNTSRNGDLLPPQAERRPPTKSGRRRSTSIFGRTNFIEDTTESNRKYRININHLEDETHAERLGEMIGEIWKTRHGFRITSRFRDGFFYWKPLARIDLEERDRIYMGLCDLTTWTLAGNQAIVLVDNLRVGRTV